MRTRLEVVTSVLEDMAGNIEEDIGARTELVRMVLEDVAGSAEEVAGSRLDVVMIILEDVVGNAEDVVASRLEVVMIILEDVTTNSEDVVSPRLELVRMVLDKSADVSDDGTALLEDSTDVLGESTGVLDESNSVLDWSALELGLGGVVAEEGKAALEMVEVRLLVTLIKEVDTELLVEAPRKLAGSMRKVPPEELALVVDKVEAKLDVTALELGDSVGVLDKTPLEPALETVLDVEGARDGLLVDPEGVALELKLADDTTEDVINVLVDWRGVDGLVFGLVGAALDKLLDTKTVEASRVELDELTTEELLVELETVVDADEVKIKLELPEVVIDSDEEMMSELELVMGIGNELLELLAAAVRVAVVATVLTAGAEFDELLGGDVEVALLTDVLEDGFGEDELLGRLDNINIVAVLEASGAELIVLLVLRYVGDGLELPSVVTGLELG